MGQASSLSSAQRVRGSRRRASSWSFDIGRRLGDADHVAMLAGVVLVVRLALGRAAHDLAVLRVLTRRSTRTDHRLVHLVADHRASTVCGSSACRRSIVGSLASLLRLRRASSCCRAARCCTRAISRRTLPRSAVESKLAGGLLMRSAKLLLVQLHRSRLQLVRPTSAAPSRSPSSSPTASRRASRTWWRRAACGPRGGTPRARRRRRRPRSRRASGPASRRAT